MKDMVRIFSIMLFALLGCTQARTEETSPQQKKWFPGHYISAGQDGYGDNTKAMEILQGPDGDLFTGLYTYVTWREIETTAGVYNWHKIDDLLDRLPAGKKLGVSLTWLAWTPGVHACPDDMVGNVPDYDGGEQFIPSEGRYCATIYMPRTMDRYLAFAKAFADRYDSDPRLAFVTTSEIPYDTEIKIGQYDQDVAIENMYRLLSLFSYFQHTPSGILGAWWSFSDGLTAAQRIAARTDYALAVKNAAGGFGFPDLVAEGTKSYENAHFRPSVLEYAGEWASWMGVEYFDYLPENYGTNFPDDIIASANKTKTNFIWWLVSDLSKQDGGKSLRKDVLPYLRKFPDAGITRENPYVK